MGIGRVWATGCTSIDEQGAIIDEFGPNYAEFDLPIVDGLAAPRPAASAIVDDARASLAGASARRTAGASRSGGALSQIDVTDPRNAVVILKDDTALLGSATTSSSSGSSPTSTWRPALRERVPRSTTSICGSRRRVRPCPRRRG